MGGKKGGFPAGGITQSSGGVSHFVQLNPEHHCKWVLAAASVSVVTPVGLIETLIQILAGACSSLHTDSQG